MKTIYPPRLKEGDKVMVVAPSNSLSFLSKSIKRLADKRLNEIGLEVTYAKNVLVKDVFESSSIKERVDDLHQAFADKSIKAVFAAFGGFNCNQLLPHLDWNLIKNNPKIFIGYSDTTALLNAIFAKTGLVTYSGPCYSKFGQKLHFDFTFEHFKQCVMSDEKLMLIPSDSWSDDKWYKNQDDRMLMKNNGWLVINQGNAQGKIIGGNLCTLNLLQGTEFFPNLKDAVLFIEDDHESSISHFDRDLESLTQLPGFYKVKGIVIGRFQKESRITSNILREMINRKEALKDIPIIGNVDFGHTDPMITFPIGGEVKIVANDKGCQIEMIKH